MRSSPARRTTVVAAALALAGPFAQAQNAQPGVSQQGNAQLSLPYGAKDANPVSRWTPRASAGRQLTLSDLMMWRNIRTPQLSNDGKWFAYVLAPNEGDAEVVIRGTAAGAKEMRFGIGEPPAPQGGFGAPAAPTAVAISGNGKWAAFLIYASQASSARRGGQGGAGPGAGAPTPPSTPTKLGVVNLGDGIMREFENVRAFRFAGDRSDWIAVHHAAPVTATAGANSQGGTPVGGGGGAGPGAGNSANMPGTILELVNLNGGADAPPVPIANVSEFAFNDAGEWVAYSVSNADFIGNGIQARQLSTGITRSLDAQKASYRRIVWADSIDALAAARVVSDTAGADERNTILLWTRVSSPVSRTVEITLGTAGIPAGLVLSSEYAIAFGDSAKVLYVGLREPRPPRPRGNERTFTPPSPGGVAPGAGNTGQVAAAPQTDAEVPSLILWHWRDPRTQATQQVQETQDRGFAYVAAYSVASAKLVRLTDDKMRTVQLGPRSTWAVGIDIDEYERDAGIKGFAYRDLYAIDIATGARKLIQKKVPGNALGGFGGGPAAASPFSADNSKYAYYDTGDWKIYDFATSTTKSITAGVPGKFWDTEDDHNQVKPPVGGGLVGWSRDGGSVIVRDNWDMWRLPLRAGPAINITGNGEKGGEGDQIRYQSRLILDPRDRRGIDLGQPMYVETYGEWSKKEGLAQVDPMRGGVRQLATEDAKVDYRRARDANIWAYTRQTVVKFPDWYVADAGLTNERRLTDANPQQKEVAWTPGARLVEYSCENGGRHQAMLYLPAGYEQGKTYPMLTYIYERLSQEYNVYAVPNLTRYSNPSVFTSRGYAFLKPDIEYKVNDPGRSAVWCVVPAVKAAIATGMIDTARIGLQGHSWGGYQTSFITTQTRIFKTAVAGAPLTDMTSMFGSVYWNTGNTDGSIFISSQGRFTGGPNEVPEAYIRNSPQTFAQNLTMPFMILHNDRDGAVDFNQGITYYNHLRQLAKEVVLLEYVGENHGLARPANQKDYALRMTEWFDTFLRDQPAPKWMQDGIPRLKMEAHLKDRRPLVDRGEPERPRLVP